MALELRTDRLLMRAWADADRAPFAALNADSEVMEHFPGILSRAESDQLVDLIQEGFATRGWGLWAIELLEGGIFIGFVGLNEVPCEANFTPAVETGWRLGRDYWGRGYATEAASAALDYGFGPLRLDRIVSFTSPSNLRSQAVMRRIGLTAGTLPWGARSGPFACERPLGDDYRRALARGSNIGHLRRAG